MVAGEDVRIISNKPPQFTGSEIVVATDPTPEVGFSLTKYPKLVKKMRRSDHTDTARGQGTGSLSLVTV